MLVFKNPQLKDAKCLAEIGASTFIESHASSASKEDIDWYVRKKFTEEEFIQEMKDDDSIFKAAYFENELVGYSKIILNKNNPLISENQVCKLERLYILQKMYNKKIGKQLLDLNIELCQQAQQKGMWLNVWTGNHRAIAFYEKVGFSRIGETDFKISKNHSNPNYWYYLPI